jgi:UDP-N-acetylglucosamine 2-epimerase
MRKVMTVVGTRPDLIPDFALAQRPKCRSVS